MPRTGQMKHTAVSEFTDLRNEERPITQKQALQVVAPLDSPLRPEFIESSTGLKQIPSGTVLIYQGRRVGKVHMIHSGVVMLLRRSASGREVLVGLRSDGWYAGAISAILDKPSDYTVKTVTGCRTAQITAKHFAPQDRQTPDMTRHFILALCQEVTTRTRKQRRMSRRAEDDSNWHVHEERSRQVIARVPLSDEQELAQLLALSQKHLGKLIDEIQVSRPTEGSSSNLRNLIMETAPSETKVTLTPVDVLQLASWKNNGNLEQTSASQTPQILPEATNFQRP